METSHAQASRGRPREFDCEAALDRALDLFWRQGYEGTSLSDLTTAMGINRPSLYAAFGNKEALFHRVLARYADKHVAYASAALTAPTARAVVERLLLGSADALTAPDVPRGCLAVQGALACGAEAAPVREFLVQARAASRAALAARLARARDEGDLKNLDPEALASFVATVSQGMSVQAAGGATREELRQVATLALRIWPDGD